MTDELRALNVALGEAESRGDRAFFEALLHPNFVMIRPSGAVATRAEFVDALAADAQRETSDLEVTVFPERRAVVRCTVVKWTDGSPTAPVDAPRFDNVRLFWKTDAAWQLVSWVNEPAREPASVTRDEAGPQAGRSR